MSDRLRVLIADDSATARHLLASLCRDDPGLVVIGEARDGAEAVALTLRLHPDIVIMDVHMPIMDGFTATRQIMEQRPTPVLAVTATITPHDVALAMRSIEAGAVGVVQKPAGPDDRTPEHGTGAFLRKVRALAGVHVIRRFEERRPPLPASATARARGGVEAIGVAASTGGPMAVRDLLRSLPVDFTVPVLVVQHIATGFLPGYVDWLAHDIALPVGIAAQGEAYLPGRVYLAPDSHHLLVGQDRRLVLDASPPVSGFQPSASMLFSSLGRIHGSAAVGVMLTGLGSDGLAGLQSLADAGGCVLAQDPATAVAPSMPESVLHAGIADLVGPVNALADHLLELCTDRKADTT